MVAVIQEAYIQGVSTRSVDDLVRAMGMTGVSKSQVSRLCEEIDERVHAFLDRPLEGDWPYVWLDATYERRARYQVLSFARRKESGPVLYYGSVKRQDGTPYCARLRGDKGEGGSLAHYPETG